MANVEERIKQLDNIRKIVQKCEDQVNGLLQEFGWTKDKLPKYNEETTRNECESAGSSSNENAKNTVELEQSAKPIDLETVMNIEYKIDAKRSGAKNVIDLNKLKRDLKRRRIKYRTTKTASLTYTEEIRELINLQMELLTENTEE